MWVPREPQQSGRALTAIQVVPCAFICDFDAMRAAADHMSDHMAV
jgi:hypothetical protein